MRVVIESLIQDIRQGLRGLLRAPAFTITALITLALGIAATTVIFSVVNAVLLEPPPYPQPNRLFVLTTPGGAQQTGRAFHYFRDRVRSFEISAHTGGTGWNLVSGRHAEYVRGVPVSREFFDVIGVRPVIGRGFAMAEDQPKGPRAVILSERLWQRVFAGKADVIGQMLQLGGVSHEVVGIMSAGFQPTPAADLWTPLQVSPRDDGANYIVIGRLRAGVTEQAAAAELDALRGSLQQDIRAAPAQARLIQWMPYQHYLGLSTHHELMLLLGAVSFLLLIACVNVASLQLVRAVARRREMATRAALGSGRGRLAQQVLAESFLLAFGGAALGLVCARWGLDVLLTFVPEGLLGSRSVGIDWRVLATSVGVSVASGVLFGLAPAASVAKLNVRDALWAGGRHTAARPTIRLRGIFTVVEVALAVVLLVAAGLLIRSFVNLRSEELGFDPANTVIGKMSLQGSSAQTQESTAVFFDRMLLRLRTIPGVSAAAVGNNIPVERGLNLPMAPPVGGRLEGIRSMDWRYISSEYFVVFGIPLRAGRSFDDRDNISGALVAIVNEAFARTVFGRPQVIGEFVNVGGDTRQIVGIVGDVKGRSGAGWTRGINAMAAPAPPAIYVPVAQVPQRTLDQVNHFFPMSWVVRTTGSSADAAAAVQQTIRSAAPQLSFVRFETMQDVIARDVETQRFLMMLLVLFASAALMLAAIGMYGLTAYTVTRRTQEVGIRMALGATRSRVLRVFLAEGGVFAVIGLTLGLAGAAVTTRVLSALVFDVKPHDPLTFAAVSLFLLTVTGLAIFFPSVQAARTNPVSAMRTE